MFLRHGQFYDDRVITAQDNCHELNHIPLGTICKMVFYLQKFDSSNFNDARMVTKIILDFSFKVDFINHIILYLTLPNM